MFDSKNFLVAVMIAGCVVFSLAGCSSSPPAGSLDAEGGEVKIDFVLDPGSILEYKASNTREVNFYGMDYNFLHTDHVTLTAREKSEEGNYVIRIKYIESKDQMIKGDEMRDYNNPVKAEGRTVEVVVTPKGEITETKGVIPGLPEDQLKGHLEQWFFELPEEGHAIGETWEKDISDSTETGVSNGVANMKLQSVGSDKGVAVAVISAKSRSDVTRTSEQGTIKGVQESSLEAKVALKGGYIVSFKGESEFRGKMEATDGTERDITNFMNYKVELVK